MNQVTIEQKESVTKSLAIIGFIAMIVLLMFVAIKLVGYLPSAFSSLASLADSVYNQDTDELVVMTPNSVVKSGESFTLTWNEIKRPGTYSFSYECTTGATLEMRTPAGDITPVTCGTAAKLEADQTSLEVVVLTDAQRFTDIPYRIIFTPADPKLEPVITESQITIVNAAIPTSTVVIPVIDEITEPSVPETLVEPEAPTEPTDNGTTYGGGYTSTVTYGIPASDPNGYTDLSVRFINSGIIDGNRFIPMPSLRESMNGAIQFGVKNIGTKTSAVWDFVAELPAGMTYHSNEQEVLKPNEEAIITIGFTGADRAGLETASVTVDTDTDRSKTNNSFTTTVKITD